MKPKIWEALASALLVILLSIAAWTFQDVHADLVKLRADLAERPTRDEVRQWVHDHLVNAPDDAAAPGSQP